MSVSDDGWVFRRRISTQSSPSASVVQRRATSGRKSQEFPVCGRQNGSWRLWMGAAVCVTLCVNNGLVSWYSSIFLPAVDQQYIIFFSFPAVMLGMLGRECKVWRPGAVRAKLPGWYCDKNKSCHTDIRFRSCACRRNACASRGYRGAHCCGNNDGIVWQ